MSQSVCVSFALPQIASKTIQGPSISKIHKELSYFLTDMFPQTYITTKWSKEMHVYYF